MALRSVVTRGYGAGGSRALCVTRGYLLSDTPTPSSSTGSTGAGSEEPDDEAEPLWRKRRRIDEARKVARAQRDASLKAQNAMLAAKAKARARIGKPKRARHPKTGRFTKG